jgi:glycosyltransferase involved in cell wall biosynthesis
MKVSVVIITYAHEKFIAEAVNSVLMQKCDFEIELIIANDCSPDKTDDVIQNILESHPQASWVKYIKHTKNLGMMANFIFAVQECQGKYIALCEGDDYWTDPLKLQKQVDFLEANSDYVMCTHATEEKNEIMNTSAIFPNIKENTTKYIEDYILNNLTATCSLMFKAEYLLPIPEWFEKIKFGDLGLILILFYRSNKKMIVLKDCMGVYRINSGSIHGSLKKNNTSLIKAYKMHLDFINTIDNELFLKNKFEKFVIKKKINTHAILANLYKNDNAINHYKHLIHKFLLTRFKC